MICVPHRLLAVKSVELGQEEWGGAHRDLHGAQGVPRDEEEDRLGLCFGGWESEKRNEE